MAGAPAEEKRHQREKIKAECLFYLTQTRLQRTYDFSPQLY